MAKKRRVKKASTMKTLRKGKAQVTGRRQTRAQIERVLGNGPLRRQPRNAPLPGMGGIRIEALDAICADIGDKREEIQAAKADELVLESQALHLLRKHGKDSWSAAGVAISRKVIEEKLIVRKARQRSATTEADEPAKEPMPVDDVFGERLADA